MFRASKFNILVDLPNVPANYIVINGLSGSARYNECRHLRASEPQS